MGSYVDITGLPTQFLEFMGYIVVDQNDEFILLNHKGEEHIIYKPKPMLYVDDENDVAIFANRPRVPAPPASDPPDDEDPGTP